MEHEIKSYTRSGKIIYQEHFTTAEKAFKAYVETIENLSKNLPKGYEAIIIRCADGNIMSRTIIKGYE